MYGLHSGQSGGATSAFRYVPNLSERAFYLQGRWNSDTAKQTRILPDKMFLSVYKQLVSLACKIAFI